MKYTCEVTINLPRQRVVELFDDPENMSKWQPGLQTYEPISGEPGQPGAKSRLVYQQGGRTIEMIETVTERNAPEEFARTYEAKGVFNRVTNRFSEVGADQTHWVTENEFDFSGVMRLFAFFMRGAFPKQTQKDMNRFKDFAESAG